jgi:acetoin utilization protein AcuB
MNVKHIMSTEIVTVELDDKLAVVKEIFETLKFHHLLVVESKKLLGIVSDRDLLKALSPNIGTLTETPRDAATLNKRVHQIMSRNPIALRSDADIYDAVDLFNLHKISCIPIVDDAFKPVGIVSWRDILREFAAKRPALADALASSAEWQALATDPAQKLAAIKLYCEQNGSGMADAKRAVEAFVAQSKDPV